MDKLTLNFLELLLWLISSSLEKFESEEKFSSSPKSMTSSSDSIWVLLDETLVVEELEDLGGEEMYFFELPFCVRRFIRCNWHN